MCIINMWQNKKLGTAKSNENKHVTKNIFKRLNMILVS